MFSALDSPTESNLTTSPQASLPIPFKDICEEDPQEKFKFSKFLQVQKAYHFFEQDFVFNVQNAVSYGYLTFKPFFASLLSSVPNDLNFDNEDGPIELSINLDLFTEQMSYDDINIIAMKNR
ncbi:hypothetical protein G6F46_007080 [Rhizopus delemar]|uniref:Uncharacterized protein n=2 Tax=Rhizopus TaxID=4842 RepID=A0A9P7CLX2_9FUNG|nr:hypothetical protein G6F36_014875 [Rhizopus arrhizus]KAG1450761.1 hypothetical protein G6F55_009528 [Rhizopus delemar]KAG1491901.1 hypothetical protein G6F54_009682 [Rhizopus delemar]KAG1505620.1 hypothetical protein G6F53_010146 [Rhizopus delemar]KAG1539848.1 hypothetical protein G6F51_008889 [Rhizopus arrhizus]